MKILLVIVASFFSSVITAQYDVVAFQDNYTEIEGYHSIALETFGNRAWVKKFELPFNFPYFDYDFDYLICEVEGTCYFEDDLDFSLRLMTFGYKYDEILDTVNIESDVRYKFGEKDGKSYLAVQLTKNRLFSDPSVDEFDSYVNFQYWIFDDGTIELRFGPSNLDHSPVYVPGEGFYLLTNEGPKPAGPQLALYHPYDENIRLEYNDLNNYTEYELTTVELGGINWWPPDGWVIRFTNKRVSTNELASNHSTKIYPNPTVGQVFIDSKDAVKNIKLYNSDGMIISSHSDDKLDLSELESGIYYLKVLTDTSFSNHKIIKI